jgi:hypothetical protein
VVTRLRMLAPGLALVASGVGALSCAAPAPASNADAGQAFMELSDAINQLRQDNALLQAQVDSLRDVVARQDTLIRRLAATAGVAVPQP